MNKKWVDGNPKFFHLFQNLSQSKNLNYRRLSWAKPRLLTSKLAFYMRQESYVQDIRKYLICYIYQSDSSIVSTFQLVTFLMQWTYNSLNTLSNNWFVCLWNFCGKSQYWEHFPLFPNIPLSSFFQGKWLAHEDDKQHLTSSEVKKALCFIFTDLLHFILCYETHQTCCQKWCSS